MLIVNVASECGYTHTHYHDLVKLQQDLEYSGLFHVLAFPCNQFGQQEPKVMNCLNITYSAVVLACNNLQYVILEGCITAVLDSTDIHNDVDDQ